ncbi:MAG: hypothetical protein WA003_03570 [Desulfuromonadaceae bacterium]
MPARNITAELGRVDVALASAMHRYLSISALEQRDACTNSQLEMAIERSCAYFFREQLPEGYWL